jgi:endonuclease/exonuclease/phosphatase family metal-dependent hydrolase
MRTLRSLVLLSTVLSFGAFAPSPPAVAAEAGKKVTFMTRNLYLGADLEPAIRAVVGGDGAAIVGEVGAVWAKVKATDFPTRAQAIADEIKNGKPDFVGLQECVTWSVGAPFDPAPATTVVYDYLQILLDALARRGAQYVVVTVHDGFTAEFPGYVPSAPGGFLDIRLHDRTVLLAKKDASFTLSNASSHDFAVNLIVPTPAGPFASTYGWNQVDVKAGQREFRLVNTHLDASLAPELTFIREMQAAELLGPSGPSATSSPVVVIGDMNSDGNGADDGGAYLQFRAAHFGDAWTDAHPGVAGITWGHDELLIDPSPAFPVMPGSPERIDFVLYRGGGITTYDADLVGDVAADMYHGLWPSDHAGLAATLRVP